MPLILLSLLVQITCVVHIIRTGRNQLWLWAVILLPAAGSLAYFITEILPGILGSPDVRALRVAAEKRLDPERELREATDALSIAATAANEIRLGDALSELGRELIKSMPRHGVRKPGRSERLQPDSSAIWQMSERSAGLPDTALRVPRSGQMASSRGLAGGKAPPAAPLLAI